MEQQLTLSGSQEVQISDDTDEFNKQDDESRQEEKRESEIESRPSTSTEDGM